MQSVSKLINARLETLLNFQFVGMVICINYDLIVVVLLDACGSDGAQFSGSSDC